MDTIDAFWICVTIVECDTFSCVEMVVSCLTHAPKIWFNIEKKQLQQDVETMLKGKQKKAY